MVTEARTGKMITAKDTHADQEKGQVNDDSKKNGHDDKEKEKHDERENRNDVRRTG